MVRLANFAVVLADLKVLIPALVRLKHTVAQKAAARAPLAPSLGEGAIIAIQKGGTL